MTPDRGRSIKVVAVDPKALDRKTRDFLTVLEVAQLSGVTERTVWADLAAGRLGAVRQGGRTLIPRVSAENYRVVPRGPDVVTFAEAADILKVSRRQLRRWIAAGRVDVVRMSPRRLLLRLPWTVEQQRSRMRQQFRNEREARRFTNEWPRTLANVAATLISHQERPAVMSIAEIAACTGERSRHLYYYLVTKRAIQPWGSRNRRHVFAVRDLIAELPSEAPGI